MAIAQLSEHSILPNRDAYNNIIPMYPSTIGGGATPPTSGPERVIEWGGNIYSVDAFLKEVDGVFCSADYIHVHEKVGGEWKRIAK